ncbi:hypothetical protein NUU61_000643 [Penicillium alfredii]|uniref:Ubiquitin-conjugating enzyme E2-binding protein n=1 Tax=Penicillium alfredii TaxID=1506179 RepID=A0A9W9KPX8_9EURO|nr:uncharacterized protein NUU61_000643 [Penicillium alfredii]KAJ5114884.1 hypothetical protein NUU61_000643 [Penicillium alfredii]
MSTPLSCQLTDVPLYLHAELLPNIRQITLYVSLPPGPTLDGVRPEIQLSESRKAVTVSLPEPFQHVTETIKLPARVGDASRRALTAPAKPTGPSCSSDFNHDYSFRMQIDPNEEALVPRDELIDEYVPWTAADMSSRTRIQCRRCSTAFLKSSDPLKVPSSDENQSTTAEWIWKDLPSGNWAEMMDFWHCHKPDPHEGQPKDEANAAHQIEGQTAQIKGYGAASQVVAIPGTVLIDVATFLVAESDCTGLKKGHEEQFAPTTSGQGNLECDQCHTVIGMEDPSANGWRLLKANVSVNTYPNDHENGDLQWHNHPIEVIVAAQLLEMIERESARRFVVHCGQENGLLLWVFNPDLRYSNTSSGHSVMAQEAMKVFFQETVDVERLLHPEMGKVTPLSVEELELPSVIFKAVSDALKSSNQMLPPSARRFNEWQVGLLSRFRRST